MALSVHINRLHLSGCPSAGLPKICDVHAWRTSCDHVLGQHAVRLLGGHPVDSEKVGVHDCDALMWAPCRRGSMLARDHCVRAVSRNDKKKK